MPIYVGVVLGSVDVFLEDWIGLDGFKLGLEAVDGVAVGATIGATTSIGEVVAIVLGLVTRSPPRVIRQLNCCRGRFGIKTCQLPLPPPSFFTFLGSASM